jgi:IclR family acetate operon transcriptional repressor
LFGVSSQSSADPNDTKPTAKRYSLQGLSRALRLLNSLAAVGAEGLSLTEAAQQVDATKSTTFSLLRTLMDFDYVCSSDPGPRYRLGPAVVHLADSYGESLPWLAAARPVARALTERTGWTSRLASHIDGHPVFQERVDGPGVIRFFTELGIREPPHISAAGKAILADLPEHEVRRIIAETGLDPRTRHTITDVEVLLRDLQLTSGRGFAVDDEEGDEGVFCIAAAFRSGDGRPLGAISITGLKADMPAWRIHQFGLFVRDAADEIAHAVEGKAWAPNELTVEGGAGIE